MSKKYDKFLRNEQWLYRKYWDEELSLTKIAKEIGCTHQAVRCALKKLGIAIRTKKEA